jgi:hypothetical protein
VAAPHQRDRLFEDTPLDVEAKYLELWRARTDAQRLEKVLGLGRALNELACAEIRRRYPAATEREVRLRLASRSLDRETMIRAFGWDPAAHGR